MHYPLPEGSVIKNVTLGMEPDGMFYASINVEYVRTVNMDIRKAGLLADTEAIRKLSFLGLDYDQQNLYVDSKGEISNYPKFYRKSEEKLAKLQKDLARMVKGSNNYNRQLDVYFGLDPAVKQSGKFNGDKVHMSKRGSSLARRILHMVALNNLKVDKGTKTPVTPVIYDYYTDKCKSEKKM